MDNKYKILMADLQSSRCYDIDCGECPLYLGEEKAIGCEVGLLVDKIVKHIKKKVCSKCGQG